VVVVVDSADVSLDEQATNPQNNKKTHRRPTDRKTTT